MIKIQHALIMLELNVFQKKIRKCVGNKNIIINIYRIQACGSTMCGYFCIRFIDFMLKGKSLLENAQLFPPNK